MILQGSRATTVFIIPKPRCLQQNWSGSWFWFILTINSLQNHHWCNLFIAHLTAAGALGKLPTTESQVTALSFHQQKTSSSSKQRSRDSIFPTARCCDDQIFLSIQKKYLNHPSMADSTVLGVLHWHIHRRDRNWCFAWNNLWLFVRKRRVFYPPHSLSITKSHVSFGRWVRITWETGNNSEVATLRRLLAIYHSCERKKGLKSFANAQKPTEEENTLQPKLEKLLLKLFFLTSVSGGILSIMYEAFWKVITREDE